MLFLVRDQSDSSPESVDFEGRPWPGVQTGFPNPVTGAMAEHRRSNQQGDRSNSGVSANRQPDNRQSPVPCPEEGKGSGCIASLSSYADRCMQGRIRPVCQHVPPGLQELRRSAASGAAGRRPAEFRLAARAGWMRLPGKASHPVDKFAAPQDHLRTSPHQWFRRRTTIRDTSHFAVTSP